MLLGQLLAVRRRLVDVSTLFGDLHETVLDLRIDRSGRGECPHPRDTREIPSTASRL